MKTCKKLLAITIALVLLVSTLVSGLVVSAAEVGTLVLTSQPITESDADQTVTVDLTFDYTEAVAAPHNLVTLSTDSTFVLESIVVTSVNGIAASEYDTETDPEGEVSANPCPIYIKENGINLSEGKFILEAITVDSNSIEDVVITATYTIPANTVAGKYPVTATADYTDYYECDDTLGITNCDIVVEAAAPECDHAGAEIVYVVDGSNYITKKVCACGYEEVVATVSGIKYSHSLNLKSDISINFVVLKTSVASYIDNGNAIKGVFVRTSGNTGEDKVTTITDYVTYASGANYWNFQYTGIAACEIGDAVSAALYAEVDGIDVLLYRENYNVLSYIDSQLSKATKDTGLLKLLMDLVVYGSKAQTHFKYNASNLVSDLYTDAINEYATKEPRTDFTSVKNTDGTIGFNSALNLNYKVLVNVLYQVKTYTGATDKLSMRVSYYDAVAAKDEVIELPYSELSSFTYGSNYLGLQVGIPTANLGAVITAELLYDGVSLGTTYTYSVESYADTVYGNANTNSYPLTLQETVLAMMAYGDSCADYYIK